MKLFTLKFIAFFTACILCLYLQKAFGFTPIFSAALIGFTGTFYPFSFVVDKKQIHGVIYSGAFAGMCSLEYLEGPQHVLLLSFIGCCIYLCLRPYLNGFGGKLGTIAFISSALLILSRKLW